MYHIAHRRSRFYDSAQTAIKIRNYQQKSFEMNPRSSEGNSQEGWQIRGLIFNCVNLVDSDIWFDLTYQSLGLSQSSRSTQRKENIISPAARRNGFISRRPEVAFSFRLR